MRYCLKLGDKYHTNFIDLTALKRKLGEACLYSVNGSETKQILNYLICNGVSMKNKKILRLLRHSEVYQVFTHRYRAEEIFKHAVMSWLLVLKGSTFI